MTEGDGQLPAALDGYANFLAGRELALPKHQPYLPRWVRGFLHFPQAHGGCTFEQTLDLFLAEIGGRAGVRPWQIQQAADAVRSHRACSRPNRPFPRCHALPALPTLPPADELAAPPPTRIDLPAGRQVTRKHRQPQQRHSRPRWSSLPTCPPKAEAALAMDCFTERGD